MKKIVRGNDFLMKIPVRKMVGKEQVKFALPACTDIVVNLVGAYRRHSLEYGISVSDDSVIEARVEGEALGVGNYALEVKGRLYGNDWRSNEYEQVQIVDNNASGDTVFEPSEGEDSVEMDTAIVVLPPTADTEALIAACKEATEACRKTTAEAEAAESGRKAAEEARETAESQRRADERAREVAEDQRSSNESSREDAEVRRISAETERKTAETKRATAEDGRKDAEAKRAAAEKARETVEAGRVKAETERAVAEAARAAAEQKRQEDTDRAVKHAESVDVSLSGAEIVVTID